MLRCLTSAESVGSVRREVMDDLPMHGRVALVAGASKGIGAATAEAFAAAGAAVVLGARDTAALQAVVKRIEAAGGRAIAAGTDVDEFDRGIATNIRGTF